MSLTIQNSYHGNEGIDPIDLVPSSKNEIPFTPYRSEPHLNSFFQTFKRDFELYEKLFDIMNSLTKDSLDHYQHGFSFASLNDEQNAALNHVLISLKAYYDSSNPVLSFDYLKYKTIEFEGAAILKKIRKASIINHYNGISYDPIPWYDEVPKPNIKEIGDIFNYQYCFPWEAVDEYDYLQSQIPVITEDRFVKKFRKQLDILLSQCDTCNVVDRYEVLLNLSGSKCISRGKKKFHYLEKSRHLDFSLRKSPGERIFITTAPADGRDAIINKIEDLNRIQWIDYQLDNILQGNEVFNQYIVEKDEDIFLKKYEDMFNDNNYFLMRDIKKEGLTKPKYLLKIMLEGLYRRFPECHAFEATSFYDGPWYHGDKGGRGHGLGMANNLTTLMQIICFRMLKNSISKEGLDIPTDMICHNDDIIIAIQGSIENRDDVLNFDAEILENLGILLSRDKSFSSSYGGIICERYCDRLGFHKKESYNLREKLLMFTCINVTHFKSCLSTYYYKYRDEINIEPFIAKYGYEFSQKEYNLPISVGGWQRLKSYKVSFDLVELEKNYCPEVYRIWKASRENRIKIHKKKVEKFYPPIYQLFPQAVVPESLFESFSILTDRQMSEMYFRFKHAPVQRKNAWIALYKKRQQIFKETNCVYLPFESVIPIILSDGRNYFPLNCMIDRWVDIEIHKGYMDDPYIFKNPMGCALKKMSLIDDPDLVPAYYPLECRSYDKISTADSRKSLGLTIQYLPPIYIFREEETVIPVENQDFIDFFRSYPAPLLLGKVVQMYGLIPILKPQYFIEKDTWDNVTKEEFLLYNNTPWLYRTMVIPLKRKFNVDNSVILSFIDDLKGREISEESVEAEVSLDSSEDDVYEFVTSLKREKEDVEINEIPEETEVEDPWVTSWNLLCTVTDRGKFYAYDEVLFQLEPTMYEIVMKMKAILQDMHLASNLTDPDLSQQLALDLKQFEEEYPDFYNEFIKPTAEPSNESENEYPEDFDPNAIFDQDLDFDED